MSTPSTPGDLPKEAQPLTEKETAILEEVKTRLKDRVIPTETMLIQFVRGYSYEEKWADKVVEMLTKTLDWREEKHINTICDRKLDKRAEFKTAWTTVVTGRDPQGRYIAVDRLGNINPSDLMKKFTVEELQMHHTQNQEFLGKMKEELFEKEGKRLYKIVSILDLNGIGMAHTSGSFTGPARQVMDIDQWFYPESMHKMYVVNAPWVFKAIWAIVRPWLHPITQSKIQVCSSSFLEELEKDGIGKDKLPDFLGGTARDLLADFEANWKPKQTTDKPKKLKKKKKKTHTDGASSSSAAAPATENAEGSEESLTTSQ